jgi:hypothetical protein
VVDVLANDADVDGDTLSVASTTQGGNGTVTINGDDTLTYTPNPGFDGTDAFTYRATDGQLDSNDATVTVSVGPVSATKFFVVDNAADGMFQYGADGTSLGSTGLAGGNPDPRGAASNVQGMLVWVLDKSKVVFVYDSDGNPLGSWTAEGLNTPEGIATDGTNIWIVDRRDKRVFEYTGAAGFTSGSHASSSDFALDGSNGKAQGITTDGNSLWVVDDNKTNRVFQYDVATGSLLGSWIIEGANSKPAGITIDPSNVSDIWIVDGGSDEVFQYTAAASRTSGSQTADAVFSLAAGNTDPKGIADPPPASEFAIGSWRQRSVLDLPTRISTHEISHDPKVLFGNRALPWIDVFETVSRSRPSTAPAAVRSLWSEPVDFVLAEFDEGPASQERPSGFEAEQLTDALIEDLAFAQTRPVDTALLHGAFASSLDSIY